MGWSPDNSGFSWSYHRLHKINESDNKFTLLKYKNTNTATPQVIKSVFVGMATGDGTYTQGSTVSGTGQPYKVWVTIKDSYGVTHTSNTITVSNKTNGGNDYTTQTKTFTFSTDVIVDYGKEVSCVFHFQFSSESVVAIVRKYDDSSTYGGSVTNTNMVKIYADGSWKNAVPYVYDDGSWKIARAYVYSGGDWQPTKV